MPFGSELLAGGGIRFRLWAPGIPAVQLHVEGILPDALPMQVQPDGWHTLDLPELPGVAAGTRYQFQLPDGLRVPDPASRCNPDDVHGASEVIDPCHFDWPASDWCGRPWHEAIIYELHVGTFSPSGDFAGVEQRLDYLADLGITAIEIMPVADFPGQRNWGYDGVLLFAPDARYGHPEDFKRLIAAAHARGLMVILDVVYNHFGPDGNYLYCYCPEFFNPVHHTPWGAAINFDGPQSRTVRDFYRHNALYWIEEYQLDGLRLDAIHAICDDSTPDIIEEIRAAIDCGPGRERHVHLILENDRNSTHYLKRTETRRWQDGESGVAQWNDDIHHALHAIATGETDGYYADYATDPFVPLARCLAEGFAYQGEPSPFRGGAPRGEPSAHLPPTAFVNFLQTHDQIGNRAFGERLCQLATPAALEAVTAVLLLAPQPPLLFMGEEFAASQPFLFFCDFAANLAQSVTDGRRREFAGFKQFAEPAALERIPDPNAIATFAASVLDWTALERSPHAGIHTLYRRLLMLRRQEIVPRLVAMAGGARVARLRPQVLRVQWRLGDDSRLELLANLGNTDTTGVAPPHGRLLFSTTHLGANAAQATDALANGHLPPWSVSWHLTARPVP